MIRGCLLFSQDWSWLIESCLIKTCLVVGDLGFFFLLIHDSFICSSLNIYVCDLAKSSVKDGQNNHFFFLIIFFFFGSVLNAKRGTFYWWYSITTLNEESNQKLKKKKKSNVQFHDGKIWSLKWLYCKIIKNIHIIIEKRMSFSW